MAKKKKVRQVLGNPFTSHAIIANETLKQVLIEKLSKLYPKKNVPTQVILQELTNDEKKELFDLPPKERSDKIKTLKNEKRQVLNADKGLLDKDFQAGIFMGLKSTLKNLQKNNVQALIYDCNESNFEALKVLFDKGQVPMIPINDLSKIVLETVEFPAMVVSFARHLDPKIEPFFKDIFDIIETLPGSKNIYNPCLPKVEKLKIQETPKSFKKKDVILKSPIIQILKRNDLNKRVFDPVQAKMEDVSKEDAFQGDFIGFHSRSKKRSKSKSVDEDGFQYKKTKIEMMK